MTIESRRSPAPREVSRARVRLAVMSAAVAWAGACGSSTAPMAPSSGTTANIAGPWLDSADFMGQADVVTIAQRGDSVVVTSPYYFVRFNYGGNLWWGKEGAPDSAAGIVTGDSIALCDVAFGPPCPNEIAYLRGDSLVLYLAISLDGNPLDSTFSSVIYRRGAWSANDTIPPPSPPPPMHLAGGWVSDSLPWADVSCPAIIQIGLSAVGPFDSIGHSVYLPNSAGIYQGVEWTRTCGSMGWNKAAAYSGSTYPAPCTPADGCVFFLFDTTGSDADDWYLATVAADSLADITPISINTGLRPPFFLRDSSIASLARLSATTRGIHQDAAHAALAAVRRRRRHQGPPLALIGWLK